MKPLGNTGLRRVLAGLLLVAVLPVSFLREARPVPTTAQRIAFTPVAMPSPAETAPHLGAFRLERIWRMTSRHGMFGGYSTLQRLRGGQFLTISDAGTALRFSAPGEKLGTVHFIDFLKTDSDSKNDRDAESSAYDPATGQVWIGWEGTNSISRHDPALAEQARARPAAMHGWSNNSGAESMARLPDGRFLVLDEGFTSWTETREHPALLFPGDPTGPGKPIAFRLSGPEGFSPTDVARLPDGRMLILMRRLVWPMPYRFVGRIALADPKAIRAGGVWRAKTVAYLSSSLPVDNFEGIVAEPGPDGRVTVWLISDDNGAASQRTLLWKMTVDPRQLD